MSHEAGAGENGVSNGQGGPAESSSMSYNFGEPVYAAGFSREEQSLRAAVGSLNMKSNDNWIALVESPRDAPLPIVTAKIEQKYPVTEIKWHPLSNDPSKQLFAATSDCLQLFRKSGPGKIELVDKYVKNSMPEMSAPYTSFDWSSFNPQLICCSSIDNTCSIWDIEKKVLVKQVIAHDKEVLDISFSKDSSQFVTVSADATLRQFDLRDLSSCQLLYESKHPLLHVSYNKNCQYIAVTSMSSHDIYIIDPHKVMRPAFELRYHKGPINNIDWSPVDPNVICSISDDMQAHLWKLNPNVSVTSPLLEYTSEVNMVNVSWSAAQPEWIGIIKETSFSIIKSAL